LVDECENKPVLIDVGGVADPLFWNQLRQPGFEVSGALKGSGQPRWMNSLRAVSRSPALVALQNGVVTAGQERENAQQAWTRRGAFACAPESVELFSQRCLLRSYELETRQGAGLLQPVRDGRRESPLKVFDEFVDRFF
jgi:hypothetical protein